MQIAMMIAGGYTLLCACLLIGRWLARDRTRGTTAGAMYFVLLWFAASVVNLWAGVFGAGHSFAAELRVFIVVFFVPVLPALAIWRRRKASAS